MADLVPRISKYFLLLFILSFALKIHGQTKEKEGLFVDKHTINPEDEGSLALSIDNISFFKDNESDGDIMDGYTLPGFRLQPRLIFYPSANSKLEGGVSLLKYWGADKYPCYSYGDIALWKANTYQAGFHILPYFRAQIQASKQVSLVLGMLYGGSNHNLVEPLYNPELNLTADPETGAQFLYNSRVASVDLWANWESFIFRNDLHKEAFTVGNSTMLHITNPTSFFSLSIPFQGLMTHRGGELDTLQGEGQTLVNAATGIRFQFNIDNPGLKNVALDVMGAGYDAIDGDEKVPFSSGWAIYADLSVDVWNMNCKFGYWKSDDYLNLMGNPIYGNASLTLPGRNFRKPTVLTSKLSYEQPFGNGIYLGADTELFYCPNLESIEDGYLVKKGKSVNYSFGLYIRINPSLPLKKIF